MFFLFLCLKFRGFRKVLSNNITRKEEKMYYIRRYYKCILIIIGVVVFFLIGYFYYGNSDEVVTLNETKLTKEKKESEEKKGVNEYKTLFIDVKGSVNAPGVYEIDEGKRVIDAINLAGGLTENADTINLNLSKKLTDEMYIVVYSKDEIYNYKKNTDKPNEEIKCASVECVCPDVKNDACINKENNNDETIINDKVSINNASKEELMNLSGIGESKAEAIISYRNENGDFQNIEDIKNVSGIGDALFEKIKDNITI